MIKEELKKFFRSSLKWVLLIVFLLNLAIICIDYKEFKSQVGDIKEYNKLADSYEGKLDIQFVDQCRKNSLQENYADQDGNVKESTIKNGQGKLAYFYSDYWMHGEYYKAWLNINGETDNNPISYNALKKYVNNSENKDEVLYPIKKLEYKMLDKIGAPNYYYNIVGIKKIMNSITGGMISFFSIMLVVTVTVASVFSIENISNMNGIILTSINGRKRIIRAKMIVVQLISIFWVSVYYWVSVWLNLLLYDNCEKLSLPLNSIGSFYMSPYFLNIGQYLIIGYLFYLVGTFAIIGIFSVISVAIKNIVVSLGISLLIFLVPLFLPTSGLFGTIGILCPNISMQANQLFQNMQAINIAGKPVLLCYIAPFISLIIGIIMNILVFHVYLKRNIE